MSSCIGTSSPCQGHGANEGERIGEAKQPGPATEAVVTRKGDGQHPQKITASFCKSSSTWKWSTNVAPRSFGANRSTPGKALQAWIHSRGGEFTEESLEALHALQEAWSAEQPGPASPLKTPRRGPREDPEVLPQLPFPCARAYGRSQGLRLYTGSETYLGELNALQGRACLTERHIPQTCLAMLGGLLRHMLVDQGPTGTEPSLADYIFVLPKLIWPKPPGKARWKTRVKNINERMALAQQGKWKTLLNSA